MHFDFSLHVSVPARIRAKPLIAGWPGGGKTNSTERNSRQGFTDFWRAYSTSNQVRWPETALWEAWCRLWAADW